MRSSKDPKEQPPIDPYTGEPEPLAEDAGKVIEIVPVDSGDRQGEDYLLEEEDADAISQRIIRYSQDKDVRETFEERQKFAGGGRKKLEYELDEYHGQDPGLSADDLDTAWEYSNASGEESAGGSTPTPDQNIVDNIGDALGLTYEDDEPLEGGNRFSTGRSICQPGRDNT